MHIDLSQFLGGFFIEAAEHLTEMEAGLLELESTAGSNPGALDRVFRAAHTIKGACGTLGLTEVAGFTHHLEGLLDRMRTGQCPVAPEHIDLLLRSRDTLATLLEVARNGGTPPDTAVLVHELECAQGGLKNTGSFADTSSNANAKNTKAAKTKDDCPSKHYRIEFTPHSDLLCQGGDPLLLLRELEQFGQIKRITASADSLPLLTDLEPTRSYLSWSLEIETKQAVATLEDVFLFVREESHVRIEPLDSNSSTQELETKTSSEEVVEQEFIGAWLVRRGVVTAEQVIEALDLQHRRRPLLGQLALRQGLMTVADIFATLNSQGPNGRFGETAIRLKYLTPQGLDHLLAMQTTQVPLLGKLLVELKAISPEQLDSEITLLKKNNISTEEVEEFIELPTGPYICEMPEVLAEFLTEAQEHLEQVDRFLLSCERNDSETPLTNQEVIDGVYRAFHTIKGVASMLELVAIQRLAHEAENLLGKAREGMVQLTGTVLDLIFASSDGLKRQFEIVGNWVSAGGGILALDPVLPELLKSLSATAKGQVTSWTPAISAGHNVTKQSVPSGTSDSSERVPTDQTNSVRASESSDNTPLESHSSSSGSTTPVVGATTNRSAPNTPMVNPASGGGTGGERETVRVDRDRLDKLVNTIGELVIAQSMVQQEMEGILGATNGSRTPNRALPELCKIVRDLQEMGLALRMVPLQGTFQRVARVVRDLARKLGKQVRLELHGEETELDKTVVDQLGDPLLHMVRNSLDHGIEMPEQRLANGKPAEGRLSLRAYHQGGNVYLELEDNGKGLDRAAILAKAIERGLITESQKLSDTEICSLIFAPGFSTAKVVTDVSGRGVGMDVVRRNVEALQGSIHIRSTQGQGTTFTIRLPLTLAILDGLSVGLGDEVFILPLLSVIESFRPRSCDVHRIAGRGEVVVVRGETVPLFRLARLLGRRTPEHDPANGLLVLLEDQGRKYALLVDELLGQQQVVMKSLEDNFHKVEGLSGATILGDGRVAMILDVNGLTRLNLRTPAPMWMGSSSSSSSSSSSTHNSLLEDAMLSCTSSSPGVEIQPS